MRQINYIIIHCTATLQSATVQSIKNYWFNVEKWTTVGYHYLIEPDGTINYLLPESEISNGCKGYNHCAINVSYIGGITANNIPIDNRTPEQKEALLSIITKLKQTYPTAEVVGHTNLNPNKACPCFDPKNEYLNLQDEI